MSSAGGTTGVFEMGKLSKGFGPEGDHDQAELNGTEGSVVYRLHSPHEILFGQRGAPYEVRPVPEEFLKRAHHLSMKAAVITYGVILLTVLVDLITAVGIGVFVANVLTIDRMSALQSKKVKTISTADDDVELSAEEQALLDQTAGKVLLFQLAGPMIFGVAKAISREHNAIGNCQAVVFDLSEVSHLGVTAAIALENAVKEAIEAGRKVFMVGATGSTENRLKKLKLLDRLPASHVTDDRLRALNLAVGSLSPAPADA